MRSLCALCVNESCVHESGKSVKEMKDEEDDDEDDEEGLGSEASTLASAGGANVLYESYWLGKAYAAAGKHGKAVKWLTHASR